MINKILITGHTGFLGKNLYEYLKFSPNNEFLLLSSKDTQNNEFITRITTFKPNYIFHFGGEIYDESKMIESNIILTKKLLDCTKDIDYKIFINCGSSSEYGKVGDYMSENMALNPTTLYGVTKATTTMMCKAFADQYNKPVVTVRPFSVYGKYDKEHKLIPTLIRRFENGEDINLIEGNHDWIYIKDFINCIIDICTYDNIKGDIINIGTGIQTSNYRVYEILQRNIYKTDNKIIWGPRKETDSLNWRANIDYTIHKYGFKSKYKLEEGLKHYINERRGNTLL